MLSYKAYFTNELQILSNNGVKYDYDIVDIVKEVLKIEEETTCSSILYDFSKNKYKQNISYEKYGLEYMNNLYNRYVSSNTKVIEELIVSVLNGIPLSKLSLNKNEFNIAGQNKRLSSVFLHNNGSIHYIEALKFTYPKASTTVDFLNVGVDVLGFDSSRLRLRKDVYLNSEDIIPKTVTVELCRDENNNFKAIDKEQIDNIFEHYYLEKEID